MSERDRATAAQIEQALRRGPAHARDLAGTEPGAGAAASNEATTDTAADAAMAAQRLSDRLAEQGLADISYAPVDSPFGELLLAASDRGLLRLAFPEEDAEDVLERLAARVSPRIVQAPAQLDPVRRELDEYFAGRRRSFELALDWTLVGPFGRRVLGAASRIPYGKVLTYTEIAAEAGSPRGSRAAGNALGANPIPIVVPCHRVLRRGGALGGYAGGLPRKQFLLELEGAR
ncbi:MAG: methylated-DNA--[protein]-cysteine S-methyltransferase [Solirubrobacterales bacterium]